MTSKEQRIAFAMEVKVNIGERISRIDRLENIKDAEKVLRDLRNQRLVGDVELQDLRRASAELLPFRRKRRGELPRPGMPKDGSVDVRNALEENRHVGKNLACRNGRLTYH